MLQGMPLGIRVKRSWLGKVVVIKCDTGKVKNKSHIRKVDWARPWCLTHFTNVLFNVNFTCFAYVDIYFALWRALRIKTQRGVFMVLRASKLSVLKLIEIVILWVYYTIPFGFSLFWHFWDITFQLLKLLCLAKDHWWWFSTRNEHMAHIVNFLLI